MWVCNPQRWCSLHRTYQSLSEAFKTRERSADTINVLPQLNPHISRESLCARSNHTHQGRHLFVLAGRVEDLLSTCDLLVSEVNREYCVVEVLGDIFELIKGFLEDNPTEV